MLLLKNGRVVDPVTKTDKITDVVIDNDKITAIGNVTDFEGEVLNCTNMIVAPGLVDAHVHFRDPGFTYKEDILSGAKAAARGGVTSVICMANTKPPVDNVETLDYILKKSEQTDIRIYQTANVTKGMLGRELVDMELLSQNGAVGFTDDGVPIVDEAVLLKAMEQAKKLNMPISLHEEDPLFVYAPGVNKGKVSEKINYPGASRTAEDIMTARDCVLALHTGAKVCIQHISSANSVEIVRTFKKLGADIHAEATPHHFTLTEDAVLKFGTNARMNPPLRTENDRMKIIEGIQDGTIDMIVTDHAPHSADEKSLPMEKAPSGITGIETSLALGIKSLVSTGYISLIKLIELMSTNPAKFYSLTPNSVSVGSNADLVIFGEKEEQVFDKFASKASNTPFIGQVLPGKIHYTICKGKIIYKA